ncbi:MAG: murein L,D-transpeptidase family protein [Pseudomonadota bacterium]
MLTPALAACTAEDALRGVGDKRGEVPISKKLYRAIKTKGMGVRAPIMVRIFKEEDTLEVWKRKPNGRYALLADYEICKWSGKLGPKFKEGDRQAPEGFYTVAPHQLNPRSSYHLSFNMGFPNAFDRSYGRTGTHLMIHGDCSSAGCYSMTDPQIEDIYALAREALRGGQERFQIQAFPFRMTPENMAKHRNSEHF